MALSEVALGFAQDTRYRGPIECATHFGQAGSPGDGPHFLLWLIVTGGRVERAAYQTHGCPSSMAVGGGLCRLIERRELEKIKTLTRLDLISFIGPVSEGKEYCYGLAMTALIGATGGE